MRFKLNNYRGFKIQNFDFLNVRHSTVQRRTFNTGMMDSTVRVTLFEPLYNVHMELCYEHTFYNLALQMDIDKK